MANPIVDAITVISGVATLIGFGQSNLPDASEAAKGAAVNVKIGGYDSRNDYTGTEGRIEGVYAWDKWDSWLGQAWGKTMSKAEEYQFTIDTDDSLKDDQAAYVGLSAGGDGVCVAWVSVTQYSGNGMQGVWTGDIGKECGQKWYPSDQATDEGGRYFPFCTWLDLDGHTSSQSNETDEQEVLNVGSASMKFYVPAFAVQDHDKNNKPKDMDPCWWTAFNQESHPIPEQPGGYKPEEMYPELFGRAAHKPRSKYLAKRLVVSNIKSHRAVEVCNSPTSHGSDIIGSDNMYCDMETRSLHHLCRNQDVEGCVDIDEKAKKVTKRFTVAKRQVNSTHRAYDKVVRWGGSS